MKDIGSAVQEANPYESPSRGFDSDTLVPRFDAGRATAHYLQFFACLAVLSMAVEFLFYDQLVLNIAPILLFWCAYHLLHHGRRARKIVIVICSFALIVVFFAVLSLLLTVFIAGTDNMTLSVFSPTERNPEFWNVILAMFALTATVTTIFGIPLFLLNSPEARREFEIEDG